MQEREAAGNFIHGLAPWTWWVTLTFRHDVVEEHAHKVFKKWLRLMAQNIVHRHVPVAWAMEWGQQHRLHFHALLALPHTLGRVEVRLLEGHWKNIDSTTGFTQFKPYDENQGAAWYQCKTQNWDFNVACPRPRKCKKGRCIAAPGAL